MIDNFVSEISCEEYYPSEEDLENEIELEKIYNNFYYEEEKIEFYKYFRYERELPPYFRNDI